MHTLVALALLVPTLALAQPAPTVVTPPPVVIVNPPPPEPMHAMAAGPQYETVYDAYNAPLFTTGALVFVGSYGGSVIVAGSASKDELARGTDRLYIPVVGPWLALNDRGSCPITAPSCDSETTKKVLLVVDGLFQAAGVIAMVDGVLQPTSHRIVMQTTKVDTKLRVTPTTVGLHGSPGVAVFGHF